MNKADLIKQWKKDEKAHFEGWDFSYMRERAKSEQPTWNYIKIAKKLVKNGSSILDIDTGGGEILSQLGSLPKSSFAIEGYTPNVNVARKNLKKAGVKVVEADASLKIPFKKEYFDLVLNRHGTLNAKEIYRVLKKEGIFFTQQVDAKRNLIDLLNAFHAKPKWVFNNLTYRKKELEKTGFEIIKSKEWKGRMVFKDVGAIVYFLKSTAWLVDNFSVESHFKYLEKLQKKIEHKKELAFTLANFMILARKKRE